MEYGVCEMGWSVGTERRGAAQSFGCKLDVEEE